MLRGVVVELGLSERFIDLLEYCNDFDSLQVVARNCVTGEIGNFLLPLPFDVSNVDDWEIVDFVTGKRFHGEATLRRQVMNLNEVECDALKRLDLLPPNLGVANELYAWLITASEEQAKLFVYFYVDQRELSNDAMRLAAESSAYPTGVEYDPENKTTSLRDLGEYIFNQRYREDLENAGFDRELIEHIDYVGLAKEFCENEYYPSEALGEWIATDD
jgi:hypothetical protein